MNGWRLSAGSTWLDDRTLVGGSPYSVLKLSGRGARTVREVLDTGASPTWPAAERELVERLRTRGILVAPGVAADSVGTVTVVVPALSTAAAVQRVIDAVAPDVAIVVVDDGSPVPLAGRLTRDRGLTVLRNDAPGGPSAARNTGAEVVTTDWVLFCDADVEAGPGLVDDLLSYADGAVAVAPRVRSGRGSGLAGWFERSAPSLDQGPEPASVAAGRPVSYVPSAVLLVRRRDLVALGGFDERMYVGEDVDLVWRLAARGEVRYRPGVEVRHTPRPSVSAALQRRVLYGRSAASLAVRHPGTLRHVDVSVWSAVPWIVAMAGHPMIATGLAGGLTWSAPTVLPRLRPAHARQLAARGQLQALTGLAGWLLRPMLPLTLVLAVLSRTARRRLVIAILPGLVGRAVTARGTGAPITSTVAAGLVDDAAYSVGVWRGVADERQTEPLLPRVRFGRAG